MKCFARCFLQWNWCMRKMLTFLYVLVFLNSFCSFIGFMKLSCCSFKSSESMRSYSYELLILNWNVAIYHKFLICKATFISLYPEFTLVSQMQNSWLYQMLEQDLGLIKFHSFSHTFTVIKKIKKKGGRVFAGDRSWWIGKLTSGNLHLNTAYKPICPLVAYSISRGKRREQHCRKEQNASFALWLIGHWWFSLWSLWLQLMWDNSKYFLKDNVVVKEMPEWSKNIRCWHTIDLLPFQR